MENKEVQIKPEGGIGSVPKGITSRLTDVENFTKAILAIALITLVAVVVAVGGLVLDQMHFNNQTYKDQSKTLELQQEELSKKIEEFNQKLDSLQSVQPKR